MSIEFYPDPTSTPTNHANTQRTQQPIQYTHRYLLNLPKRADRSPISQQLHPTTMARDQLPK